MKGSFSWGTTGKTTEGRGRHSTRKAFGATVDVGAAPAQDRSDTPSGQLGPGQDSIFLFTLITMYSFPSVLSQRYRNPQLSPTATISVMMSVITDKQGLLHTTTRDAKSKSIHRFPFFCVGLPATVILSTFSFLHRNTWAWHDCSGPPLSTGSMFQAPNGSLIPWTVLHLLYTVFSYIHTFDKV